MASMLRPLRVSDRQKIKRLRNRCFATATDINGCSVVRVPWSVPLDRSRLPRSAIMAAQVQYSYQRLRVSCMLCNNFQGKQRSGGSPLFMINHRSSYYYGSQSSDDYIIAISFVFPCKSHLNNSRYRECHCACHCCCGM